MSHQMIDDPIERKRGGRIIEFYVCPCCGKVSFDSYTLKAPWESYTCNAQCRQCGKQVQSIDSPDRCAKCGQEMECLYEERPISIIFAISIMDLSGVECREFSTKLHNQMTRLNLPVLK